MLQSHKGEFKKRVFKKCIDYRRDALGKVLAAQVGDLGSDPQYPCVYIKLLCEQWLTPRSPTPTAARRDRKTLEALRPACLTESSLSHRLIEKPSHKIQGGP